MIGALLRKQDILTDDEVVYQTTTHMLNVLYYVIFLVAFLFDYLLVFFSVIHGNDYGVLEIAAAVLFHYLVVIITLLITVVFPRNLLHVDEDAHARLRLPLLLCQKLMVALLFYDVLVLWL